MAQAPNIDGVLIQWGDRLFFPGNRIVKVRLDPKLIGNSTRDRANAIRARTAAAVAPRVSQVMAKVTGGGRGMRAIAAHFRYISKNGRLDIEGGRGEVMRDKDMLAAIADGWRFSGSMIDDVAEPGHRREAFNIMLSMPRGADPRAVQRAAREFPQVELAYYKYLMVLHDHQAVPHVHISVRAESRHGKRLNPQGRSAAVAAEVCRETARVGCGGIGDEKAGEGEWAQRRAAKPDQGRRGWRAEKHSAAALEQSAKRRSCCDGQIMATHCKCLWRIGRTKALNAPDAAQLVALHTQARSVVDEYLAFVARDPLMQDTRNNGLASSSILSSVSACLKLISTRLAAAQSGK